MTADEEVSWLRQRVSELESEAFELRTHVKVAVARVEVLTTGLEQLVDVSGGPGLIAQETLRTAAETVPT